MKKISAFTVPTLTVALLTAITVPAQGVVLDAPTTTSDAPYSSSETTKDSSIEEEWVDDGDAVVSDEEEILDITLEEPENTEPFPEGTIAFVALEGQNVEDVVETILEDYDENAVEELLLSLSAMEADGQDSGFPGLEDYTLEEASAVLETVAENLDQVGNHIPELAAIDPAWEPVPAPVAVPAFYAGGTDATLASVLSDTPISGQAINNRRTWVFKPVITHNECNFLGYGCKVTDKRAVRITIDHGNKTSRVQMSQVYSPNSGRLGNPSFKVQAYRNSSAMGSITRTPPTSGRSSNLIDHRIPLKSSKAAVRVTGSYKIGGVTRSVAPGRSGTASCGSNELCKY